MQQNNPYFIGLDDGNYDVKTVHTSIPDGYTNSTDLPPMVTEYLCLNGKYYIPSTTRFNYLEDKTQNDRCLYLVLMGISNEILYRLNRRKNINIQEEINRIYDIVLGMGLPPLQWEKQLPIKKSYLIEQLKDGITYNYNGYDFSIRCNDIYFVPQGIAAVLQDPSITYDSFATCDIGGGTVDVTPFKHRKPITSDANTSEAGVLFMHHHIIKMVKRSTGIKITANDIEDILKSNSTLLPIEVISKVKEYTQEWVNDKIVNFLIQEGINFTTTPVIFLGGGSALLKRYINKNDLIKNHIFLKDPAHANAKGYQALCEKFYYEKISKDSH